MDKSELVKHLSLDQYGIFGVQPSTCLHSNLKATGSNVSTKRFTHASAAQKQKVLQKRNKNTSPSQQDEFQESETYNTENSNASSKKSREKK